MYRFIFIVFLFSGLASRAQKIVLAQEERQFGRPFTKIIGRNEEGVVLVHTDNPFNNNTTQVKLEDGKAEITFYSNEMKKKWDVPVSIQGTAATIEHFVLSGKLLYIFYTVLNKEESRTELYFSSMNTSDGTYKSIGNLLEFLPYDRRKNRSDFFISNSADRQHYLTFYKITDVNSGQETFNFSVYNDSLKLSYTKKFDSPESLLKWRIRDLLVDNEGKGFILGAFAPNDTENEPIKKCNILKVSLASNELLNFELYKDDKLISDVKFAADNLNKRLIVCGFYSEKTSYSSAGIIYSSIDINADSLLHNSFEPFKPKFLNEFTNERKANRGTELINYSIDNLVLRDDGGAVMLSESSYITESSNYNSYYQVYTRTYTYHYDNVLAISINPDGKTDWEGIMRKNQVSENDNAFYSSYAFYVNEDKIHFIYNRNIRRRTDLVNFSISRKGVISERIVPIGNADILLMPKGGRQISANELIIPCLNNNRPNLLKLIF